LNNAKAGSFGRFGCFSFFTTKTITCGEGGIIVCQNTDDKDLIKSIRQFGKSLENPLMHLRYGNYSA
jgi:dTDP-4-amino-4,6-dideoxygalactose transaminase